MIVAAPTAPSSWKRDDCQNARPAEKAILPFRAVSALYAGQPAVELHYTGVEQTLIGPRTIAYKIRVGGDPLPQHILTLMEMYFALEASQAALVKERDEALSAQRVAEGSLKAFEAKVEAREREVKGRR